MVSKEDWLQGPQNRQMLGICQPPEGSDTEDSLLQLPPAYSVESVGLRSSEGVRQTLYSGLVFWQ